jgi:hypothetical protein
MRSKRNLPLAERKLKTRHEGEEVRYNCAVRIYYMNKARRRVGRAAESGKGRAQRERLRRGKHEARILNQTRTT